MTHPRFKYLACLLAAAAVMTASPSAAQEAAEMPVSARQRVLDFVARGTAPQIISAAPAPDEQTEGLSAPEVVTSAPVIVEPSLDDFIAAEPASIDPTIEAPSEPEIIATNDIIPELYLEEPLVDEPALEAAIIDEPISDSLTQTEREESIVRDFSPDALARTAPSTGPESYGFFTPAARYLAQRGEAPAPRLTLRYDVTSKNAVTAVPGLRKTVDIIIGMDYAAISKSADEMVIYDFLTRRVLNLSNADGRFTNASLYAAAYRNIDTVSKMTAGGKNRSLKLSDIQTLDAFYLESSLGYAAAPLGSALSVTQEDGRIDAKFDGQSVFSATLNGPKLEDYRQAYSFIGLLYHSEPVHPEILAELKEVRAAPNAMTIHSYGPKFPDGQIFTWTLKSKMSETAGFPLPANSKSVTELKSVSPLGFVISEALAGRALGGQVEPSAMLTAINQRLSSGDALSAWVSAQSLKDRMNGCEKLTGLCRAISKAEKGAETNADLALLVKASKELTQKTTRTEAITALRPIISAPDAPSVFLRSAALAIAKTPKSSLSAAGLTDLDPAELLTQAIARNPYDLQAYRGLAQVRAARGDFIQSWDMNDALRAFPDVPSVLTAPINRAEEKLSARAPGFFPPVGP